MFRADFGAALAIGTLLAAACSTPAARLRVDLRTDMRPGVDFVGVRTEYADSEVAPRATRQEEVLANRDLNYVEGARVAAFDDVKPGTRLVRVTLLDAVVLCGNTTVFVLDQHVS